jgi:hypothetical protein
MSIHHATDLLNGTNEDNNTESTWVNVRGLIRSEWTKLHITCANSLTGNRNKQQICVFSSSSSFHPLPTMFDAWKDSQSRRRGVNLNQLLVCEGMHRRLLGIHCTQGILSDCKESVINPISTKLFQSGARDRGNRTRCYWSGGWRGATVGRTPSWDMPADDGVSHFYNT